MPITKSSQIVLLEGFPGERVKLDDYWQPFVFFAEGMIRREGGIKQM